MAGRPKVLWLTKGLDKGGAEVIMWELAADRALASFDIHVGNVLPARNQLCGAMANTGVSVHSLGAASTVDVRWVLRLSRLLREEKFDIVHSHSPLPAAVARVAAQMVRPRPRLFTTEHSSGSLYHPLTRLVNDSTAFLDDRRFAVSEHAARTRNWFRATSPEVLRHGRALPVANDIGNACLRSEFGWDQQHMVIMSVANLRPEKNIVSLVDAFAVVARKVDNARLLIVGDGPERERVRHCIERHGLNSRVQMCGYRADARQLLGAADLFALSSDIEGLPIAVVEAMQAGLPIIATEVGGLHELVSQGSEGFLVPAGDVSAMGAALEVLVRNGKLRHDLGLNARVKGERFTIHYAAEVTRNAYLQSLGQA